MSLISGSMNLLERALDYSSAKQKAISNNIANADTPNYKAQNASFSSVLSSEVDRQLKAHKTDSRHVDFRHSESNANAFVNLSYNHNGNSVDLDKEMSELAKNQIFYNAVSERLSSKYQGLTNVIKGGR